MAGLSYYCGEDDSVEQAKIAMAMVELRRTLHHVGCVMACGRGSGIARGSRI